MLTDSPWSLFNGDDLEYVDGMPPYIQSVRLFDLDDLPYTGFPGFTDEPTVRVQVQTPWPLETLLLSGDGFATSTEIPFASEFEYTFADASQGVKTLWVRGRWQGMESTNARGTIHLLTPRTERLALGETALGWTLVGAQVDAWNFAGRAGDLVSVSVRPAANHELPARPWYRVAVVDPNGVLLVSDENATAGAPLELDNLLLPITGEYTITVGPHPLHEGATGQYLVTVLNQAPTIRSLDFDSTMVASLPSAKALDAWRFQGQAQDQVRLRVVGATGGTVRYTLRGPDGWEGFANLTGSSEIITLPTAGEYTLTVQSVPGTTGSVSYSFRMERLTVIDLVAGVPHGGTLGGNGFAQMFRIPVEESAPLRVTLTDGRTANRNTLYLSGGQKPTRSRWSQRTTSPGASQQALVPLATEGDWYILLYSEVSQAGNPYTIVARQETYVIDRVHPASGPEDRQNVLTISGAGFGAVPTVELVRGGNAVAASTVEVDSNTQMTVTFAANTLAEGLYDVRLTSTDGEEATLPEAFTVIEGARPEFWANVIAPNNLGYHIVATIHVEFGNRGDAPMAAPLVVVAPRQNDRMGALLTLDQSRISSGFWTSAIPEGFSNSVEIYGQGATPGILAPGERISVPVYYAGWQQPWDFRYPPIDWRVGFLSEEDTAPLDLTGIHPDLNGDGVVDAGEEMVHRNLMEQLGGTYGDYVSMLSKNAAYLKRLGYDIRDAGSLFAFETLQAAGLNPLPILASRTDLMVSAPGSFVPSMSRYFAVDPLSMHSVGIFGSGWRHAWSEHLVFEEDGTVALVEGGADRRIFEPDRRPGGRYLPVSGDLGDLRRLPGDRWALQETSGMRRIFDSEGRVLSLGDRTLNMVETTYNDAGQLVRLTHNAGPWIELSYHPQGVVDRIDNSEGGWVVFEYDPSWTFLLSATQDDGIRVEYDYGEEGAPPAALTSVNHPGKGVSSYRYDQQGRLTAAIESGGGSLFFEYGSAGSVIQRDDEGNEQVLRFNHLGRVVSVTMADGSVRNLEHDQFGNVIRSTDMKGRISRMQHNQRGLLSELTDAAGYRTVLVNDQRWNRLSRLRDPLGRVTSFAHDNWGNLSAIVYPDGSRDQWTFDERGNQASWTNRNGVGINYSHDQAGRPLGYTVQDGSQVVMEYDDGLPVRVENNNVRGTLLYDERRFLAEVVQDGAAEKRLTIEHDAFGRRTLLKDEEGHELHYTYDDHGRLEEVRDRNDDLVIRYEYNSRGLVHRETRGNGVVTERTYRPGGEIATLVNRTAGGTIISSYEYHYDLTGHLYRKVTNRGAWNYQYDVVGRMTRALFVPDGTEEPSLDYRYTYDAVGNRVTSIENDESRAYTVNDLNQYINAGEETFRYGGAGNLVERKAADGTLTLYSYRYDGRIRSKTIAGEQTHFYYDGWGNLVRTRRGNQSTWKVYDLTGRGNLIAEYDETGATTAHYDYGHSLVSMVSQGGDRYYYLFDALGNVTELVDASGNVVNSYVYAPYGSIVESSEQIPNSFKYVGAWGVLELADDLYAMRARSYSPTLGRFLQPDPVNLVGGDINLYTYAANAPNVYVDPDGEEPVTIVVVAALAAKSFAVGAGVGSVAYFITTPAADYSVRGFFAASLAGGVTGVTIGLTGGKSLALSAKAKIGAHMGGGFVAGNTRYMVEHAGTDQYSGKKHATTVLWSTSLAGIPMKHEAFKKFPYLYKMIKDNNHLQDFIVSNMLVSLMRETILQGIGDVFTEFFSRLIGAVDPNEKSGPTGWNGFIAADSSIPYRIDFENLDSAAAPAQIVQISDPLSEHLDLDTLHFTRFGFGDFVREIADRPQYHEDMIAYEVNGLSINVQVLAGIDYSTRELYAWFISLDPETELPPAAEFGFLPPEDGTGRGMGFIEFTIRPVADIASGTEIRNIAEIIFDGQPPIATNQIDPLDVTAGFDPEMEVPLVVDSLPPTSSVSTVADSGSVAPTSIIPILFTGSDDPNGSGLSSWDLYVAEDGGDFVLYDTFTSATLTVAFGGTEGANYAFFSRARDHVGNFEPAPTSADFTITLGAPIPVSEFETAVLTGTPSNPDLLPWMDLNQDGNINVEDLVLRLLNDANAAKTTGVLKGNPLPDHLQPFHRMMQRQGNRPGLVHEPLRK